MGKCDHLGPEKKTRRTSSRRRVLPHLLDRGNGGVVGLAVVVCVEFHEKGLQAFRGATPPSSSSEKKKDASASAAVPAPLPRALDGVFARVGPNPQLPSGRVRGPAGQPTKDVVEILPRPEKTTSFSLSVSPVSLDLSEGKQCESKERDQM